MTKGILRLTAFSLLLIFAALFVSTVIAASEGPNSPDTVVEVDAAGPTGPWATETNATASDNTYATATCGVAFVGQCEWLQATDFDFAIPSGATINGIVAEIEAKSSTGLGSFCDVQIVKGGTISGTDQSACTPQIGPSDAYITFGSSSNLWGLTWTDADINATNFGVAHRGGETDIGSTNISVDHIRITVHYTAGGGAAVQTREAKVISIF